ncbi:MAG: DMT family transporter [Vicinamibacterales bacterium]
MAYFNDLSSGAYGLASAASWGAGDFCGGMAAKRADTFQVVIGAHVVSGVAFAILAVATAEPARISTDLAWCAAAGVLGAAGLLALYRGLAIGRMAVVAPVAGVLSAVVPVVAGAAMDGLPEGPTLAGFGLALIGVWLCAGGEGGMVRPAELMLPVIAGLGFGAFIVLIGRGSGGEVFWPLVASRLASITVLTAVAWFTKRPIWPGHSGFPIVALAGVLDGGGNALLVMAAHTGRLDVAGVLSSLYPAATVILAWLWLKEGLGPRQVAGLVVTLAAILAIGVK